MSNHSVAPEPSPVILPESPLVPNARLREIYTLMLQCRAFHARARALVAEGRIASELLPPPGAEAILAAVATELRAGDTLCSSRRDWLPAMLKGIPLPKVVRWLLAAPKRPLSDSAHRVQALPSRPEAQLTAILETAAAHKRKKASLVLAFLDNEIVTKISADAWQQALKTASRRRLPLLLVCRTGAAAHTHDFSTLAQAGEIPHIYVDGSDALALYRVAQESTGRARRRLGPTLIECHTENSTADNPNANPFTAMERHLVAKGVFSLAWQQEVEAAFIHQLEAALLSAEQRKTPRARETTAARP